MRLLFTTLLLIGSFSCWSLDPFSNVYLYHQYIVHAERLILKGDYADALNEYQSAFEKLDKPFATDLYNALVLSILLKRDSLTESVAMALAEKGVGENFYNRNSLFKQMAASEYWSKLLAKARVARSKFSRSNTKTSQVKQMSGLSNALYKKWSTSIRNHEQAESPLEREMNRQNRMLAGSLIDYMERYGYPSENEIGVDMINDTIISFEPLFSRLILSTYAQPNGLGSTSMTLYLDRALDSGLIKPGFYARMRDYQIYENNKNYGSMVFSEFRDKTCYRTLGESLEKIEQNRKDIALGTLDDYLKEITYNITLPKGPFLYYTSYVRQDQFVKTKSEVANYLKAHMEYHSDRKRQEK